LAGLPFFCRCPDFLNSGGKFHHLLKGAVLR